LPGYSGYIPSKVSENVHGHTFQMANDRAMREGQVLRSGVVAPPAYAHRSWDGPRPGSEIPGYMGFCPGRYADNVIGQTITRGSETSFAHKYHQAEERRVKIDHYRRGVRPPTGHMDYSGYHAYNSIDHGVDSRHGPE